MLKVICVLHPLTLVGFRYVSPFLILSDILCSSLTALLHQLPRCHLVLKPQKHLIFQINIENSTAELLHIMNNFIYKC